MKKPRTRTVRGAGAAVREASPDRFDLYELCVQSPLAMARFLEAVHGKSPCVLREDFSGGGALCKAWVGAALNSAWRRAPDGPGGGTARPRLKMSVDVRGLFRAEHPSPPEHRTAVAVDLDSEPLKRLAEIQGVRAVCADVLACPDKADVIAALNFPLGYFFERRSLVRYLAASKARLRRGGVLVADVYGGVSAFTPGRRVAHIAAPDGSTIRYEWEQREADAATGRVLNAIHFGVPAGSRTRKLTDAFIYEWRLWSLPELRDAFAEAGFGTFEVYDQEGGAIDHLGRLHLRPVEHGSELGEDWVAYVVGRR